MSQLSLSICSYQECVHTKPRYKAQAHANLQQDIKRFGTKDNTVIYVDGSQAEEKRGYCIDSPRSSPEGYSINGR